MTNGGGAHPEDYGYISFYQSASSGGLVTAQLIDKAHINPSYYPTMVWGDAKPQVVHTTPATQTLQVFIKTVGTWTQMQQIMPLQ